jgi:hypothetical protein
LSIFDGHYWSWVPTRNFRDFLHFVLVLPSKIVPQPGVPLRQTQFVLISMSSEGKLSHLDMIFLYGATARSGLGLPHHISFTITLTHTKLGKNPLDETSTSQHTTLKIDRHPCSGGIRTHNPSKQAAADPRFRPRGDGNRHDVITSVLLSLLL